MSPALHIIETSHGGAALGITGPYECSLFPATLGHLVLALPTWHLSNPNTASFYIELPSNVPASILSTTLLPEPNLKTLAFSLSVHRVILKPCRFSLNSFTVSVEWIPSSSFLPYSDLHNLEYTLTFLIRGHSLSKEQAFWFQGGRCTKKQIVTNSILVLCTFWTWAGCQTCALQIFSTSLWLALPFF